MKLSFAKTVLYEVLQVQIKTVSCKSRMFFVLLWTSLTFCHLVVFKSVYCTDVSVKVLFIYLFYFVLFYFIFFYFIVLVLPYINTNMPWVHTCSPSWTPLPPPSLPVPSLWVIPAHQPQASSIVHRTSTANSFHTWYYTFQCHSPKSSHPLPLQQSP